MAGPFNLAIRFVLELAALFGAAVTGSRLGTPPFGVIGGMVGGVGFAVLWGLFIAPRARYPQSPRFRLVAGTIVMELAAIGLIAVGETTIGAVLAAAILANAVALVALGVDASESGPR
jgi:hypothetical protein